MQNREVVDVDHFEVTVTGNVIMFETSVGGLYVIINTSCATSLSLIKMA